MVTMRLRVPSLLKTRKPFFVFEKRRNTLFRFQHSEIDATALKLSEICAAEFPNFEMAVSYFWYPPPAPHRIPKAFLCPAGTETL